MQGKHPANYPFFLWCYAPPSAVSLGPTVVLSLQGPCRVNNVWRNLLEGV